MATNSTNETVYEILENAGVWIQTDASGQGHNWKDILDDDLRSDVLDQMYDADGHLTAGYETVYGGVPYRLRACDFE